MVIIHCPKPSRLGKVANPTGGAPACARNPVWPLDLIGSSWFVILSSPIVPQASESSPVVGWLLFFYVSLLIMCIYVCLCEDICM